MIEPKKVLITEASAASRELLSKAIHELGYHVESISDEKKAWESYKKTKYDLIISSSEHLALLHQVRKVDPDTPYIVTVAVYPDRMAKDIEPYNAQCLPKPILYDGLYEYLCQYLEPLSDHYKAV